MTENDNTKDLTADEKLDLILGDMRDIKTRLSALEAQSSGTTRPLLDQIIQETVQTRETFTERIERVEKELRSMNRKFEIFSSEMLNIKSDIRDFNERLIELERRPN